MIAGARRLSCAVAAVVLAAACSNGDGGTTASTTATGPTATTSESPAAAADFTLVGLNVLHGLTCTDGNHCDAASRMELVAREVEAAGCPDVVALQEIAPWIRDLVTARVPTLCDSAYHVVFPPVGGDYIDVEMVLSRLPTRDARRLVLAGGFRRALRVRLRSDIGPVDLVVTHTGTGADNLGRGGADCDGEQTCPPPCNPSGSLFECQITQVADLLASDATPGRVAGLVVGDLNLAPEAPPMRILFGRGWLDTYLEGANPECDPVSGTGCTSGKGDTSLDVLRDPFSREIERIDYAILAPGDGCDPAFDPGTDDDGDGLGTGLFADRAARDGPSGLAWPSDHTGVALDLACA